MSVPGKKRDRNRPRRDEAATDIPRRHVDWVTWGAFLLAVLTTTQVQCERVDRGAREHAKDMANAFRLGRRVSVYEENLKLLHLLTSRGADGESLRAHKDSAAELKARGFGGAEMAAAAAVLGINLNADENLDDIERKAWGQVSDSFSEQAQRAYRLGRMLGRYDERAALLFVLFPGNKVTDTPELVEEARRTRWLNDVSGLMDELHIKHSALTMRSTLWAGATDGRAILDAVANHFAADGKQHALGIGDSSTRGGWKFFAVVAHEAGYFGSGSVLQVWPDSLSSDAEVGYEYLLSAKPDSAGYAQLWRNFVRRQQE